MKFIEEHGQFILDNYESMSTYQLAEKLDTYPNKVRRALKKLGVQLKTKSEAQKQALSSGRHKHPTKGTVRDAETKIKISESVYSYWQTLSDEEREARAETARINWESMDQSAKDNLRDSAAEAVREAAKNGSKMEIFLKNHLTNSGLEVIFHKKGLVANDNLEVDLFLPTLKVAIEIDGPAHFFPIWGQESLNKHIKADAEKAGLLLAGGFVLIRVKHTSKSLTGKHKRDLISLITVELDKIDKKFPSKKKRFIELEVS
jgi:very-short-patch-repair endonuclease